MSADPLDTLSHDIIDYLEGISDPEKVRLSKRWDKGYQTYGLSAHDHTALYEKFNPRFHDLTHDQRLRLADRWAHTGNSTLVHLGVHLLRLGARANDLGPDHFWFLDEFLESFWDRVTGGCARESHN